MEGEYVIDVDGGTYRVWLADRMPKPEVKWEWHLKHLRRIHWHKTVNKLEVEAGRCVSLSSIAPNSSRDKKQKAFVRGETYSPQFV